MVDHGAITTPALALAAMGSGDSAIMITGSHIPADRNGLKFYLPTGEVSKSDEAAILAALGTPLPTPLPAQGQLSTPTTALPAYVARYVDAFGAQALTGLRIGVYEHSSVARDTMGAVFRGLGAQTLSLGRSDVFIPVHTEAVDPDTRSMLAGWVADDGLDTLVSTDDDADRHMLATAAGTIAPGDVLGPITANTLRADVPVTPVSSTTMIDGIMQITRTRIGSPFVIAGMENHLRAQPDPRVVVYEANGGFLLGFAAAGPAGPLAPLMTRDSILPMVAPLVAANSAGVSLEALAQ